MKLSVIIVNYNVKYFLEQCLISVEKALLGIDSEIIVVDNHSADGSVEMVADKFPNVVTIANLDNKGFSKANNQAIRISKGEYVLLLNPDTVVEEDTFTKCIEYLDAHEKVGALGVKMIDGKGNYLPESKRGLPTPEVALYKMIGLNKVFPRSKRFGKYHMGFIGENETAEVDVLAGAFMMIRNSVLHKIGLLDETFFMYGEDIDLSYRITLAGYSNVYFPETSIIHYKGESTKKMSVNYVFVFYRAMVIFAKKHYKGQNANLLIFLINTAIWGRAFMAVLQRFVNRYWVYAADALLLIGGLLLIKDYWEEHIKLFHTFSPKLVYLHFPIYTLLWIIAVHVNGGYQKPYSAKNLIRGVGTGTVLIVAIYGLLPEDLRYSRGIILVGALWATVAILALRLTIHFFQFRNFNLGAASVQNTVIVGNQRERERVHKLLKNTEARINFIGFVGINPNDPSSNNYLGTIDRLDDLCEIYGITEVIFCGGDVPSSATMHWMKKIGTENIHFKIVPEERYFIIGSNSKDLNGELYTEEIRFALNNRQTRVNKRLLDVLICFFILPVNLLAGWKMGFPRLFRSISGVLSGKKTWVSYDDEVSTNHLPKIRKGVFSVSVQKRKNVQLDALTRDKLNFLYAKNYTPETDISIVWRGLRN